jgi:hypothetical protein
MKTYLSIDMDFWNYVSCFDVFVPSPVCIMRDIVSSGKSIFAVDSHHELLDDINSGKYEKIINVDYHDDLGDGSFSGPTCANWPLHAKHIKKYIWRHPHPISDGIYRGICNPEGRFPSVTAEDYPPKVNKTWREERFSFRKSMFFGFPVDRIIKSADSIGICFSSIYLVGSHEDVFDAIRLIYMNKNKRVKMNKSAIESFSYIMQKRLIDYPRHYIRRIESLSFCPNK